MSKRHAAGQPRPRKKNKRSGYASVDLDPPDERPDEVEFIRVWDVTASKTTGRISATRTTHLHVSEGVSKLTHEEPTPTIEDVSVPADHEPNKQPPTKLAKKRGRRKKAKENNRKKKAKENDSVSSAPIPPSKPIITR